MTFADRLAGAKEKGLKMGRCHHWLVVAALLAVVQVMPAAEQTESTDAKSRTWQEIHLPCGFYRWEFGKEGSSRMCVFSELLAS